MFKSYTALSTSLLCINGNVPPVAGYINASVEPMLPPWPRLGLSPLDQSSSPTWCSVLVLPSVQPFPLPPHRPVPLPFRPGLRVSSSERPSHWPVTISAYLVPQGRYHNSSFVYFGLWIISPMEALLQPPSVPSRVPCTKPVLSEDLLNI